MKSIFALMLLIGALNAQTTLFFVSQATFLGDAGRDSMDAACDSEGNDVAVGDYVAAVADSSSAEPNVKPRGKAGVVVDTLGNTIMNSLDELFPDLPDVNTYSLLTKVLDKDGFESTAHVWSGSITLSGTATGSATDCTGWSVQANLGVAGNADVVDANWWLEFFDFCSGNDGVNPIRPNAVYCMQAPDAIIVEDPVFDGFDGSHFEFQGLPNQVFNLITSYNFNLNALFVPIEHGTFMGAAGIKVGSNEIYVDGNRTVTLNGESVKQNIENSEFSIVLKSNGAAVSSGAWTIDIKSVAANRIDIRTFLDTDKLSGMPHGVLGQTVQNIGKGAKTGTDNHGAGVIEGSYLDYLVADGIFGNEFEVSRFNVQVAKGSKRSLVNGVFSSIAH